MESTSQEGKGPGQNKKCGEKMLAVSLSQSGFKADPHIRLRVKTLKGHFAIVHDMLCGPNTSGFGYDNTTKCVVAEKPVWDAYIQSHKKFKDKSFHYHRELCTIFGKYRATRIHAETHADIVEELEREEATVTPMENDEFDILGDGIDTMNFESSQDLASIDNTSDVCSSRRKRKTMGKSVEETIYEIAERSADAMTSQMERTALQIKSVRLCRTGKSKTCREAEF